MQIINIDRKTIKKNPNAGNTQTSVLLNRETTFSGKVTGEEFERLEKLQSEGRVLITSYSYETVREDRIEMRSDFYVLREEDAIFIPKRLKIHTKFNYQTFNHLPETEFFYSYKPTLIKCENRDCHGLVPYNEIIKESDDDYYEYEVCPYCGERDTFDYKFEKLKNEY